MIYLSGMMSSASLLILMTITVFRDQFSFWPPGKRDWRWLAYWGLATVNSLAILYLVLTDLGALLSLSGVIGGLISVIGVLITLKAIKDLSMQRTSGLEKQDFVEKGLYMYSRNPQVVGNLTTLFGVVSLLRSLRAISLSLLTGFWLIMMVFAEEKWLRQKYGEEYDKYRTRTSRFI